MIIIRREKPEDLIQIWQVNAGAFDGPAEASLVDLLRSRGKVLLSLVAENEGQIVGHVLFSPVTIESGAKRRDAVGLGPLAVSPELQRKGIGSLLVKAGLEELRQAGHQSVVVLGHPAYYPRFGFAPASKYGIKCDYDVPDEVFMALELGEGSLRGLDGIAKYQPEFDEV